MTAIEIEMRSMQVKEWELLVQMNNHTNDIGLRYGYLSVQEWQKRNKECEEWIKNKIKNRC